MALTTISYPIPPLNKGGRPTWKKNRSSSVKVGIFHFDASHKIQSTWASLLNAGLSVHYGMDRIGKTYLFVETENTCYHAGLSTWLGESHVNDISVGVEINNFGWTHGPIENNGVPGTRLSSEQVPDYDGRQYFRKEGYRTRVTSQPGIVCPWDERESTRGLWWTKFTQQQKETCGLLAIKWLTDHSDLVPENIVGHEHVAPGRKLDPGPAFQDVWRTIASEVERWAATEAPRILDPEWKKSLRVQGLQSHLSRLGLYEQSGIDGNWGPRTQDGIEQAKERYKISTRADLANITTLCNELRLLHF